MEILLKITILLPQKHSVGDQLAAVLWTKGKDIAHEKWDPCFLVSDKSEVKIYLQDKEHKALF